MKKSKAILINPLGVTKKSKNNTYSWVPIGIIYIASYLRERGINVDVIDLCVSSKKELYKKIKEQNPEFICISCNTPTYKYAKDLAKEIKRRYKVNIVFGGVHPSLKPKDVLTNSFIDYVIVGEGEEVLYNLLIGKHIQGLCYKEGKNLFISEKSELIDITSLPMPAYDLLKMERYINDSVNEVGFRSVEMFASRGCPYNCSFCAVNAVMGRKLRLYPPDKLVKEMIYLTNKYNAEGVWFKDSTFTANKEWVIEFCNELEKQKAKLVWSINARVDNINMFGVELLKRMKSLGLRSMWFGIESGSPRIIKKLKKGINMETSLAVIDMCKSVGIESCAFFMIGLPDEDINDIRNTFYFSLMLNADINHWHIFNPYIGSELHDEMMRKGMIKNIDYDKMSFNSAVIGNKISKEQIQDIFNKICNFYYKGGENPFRRC